MPALPKKIEKEEKQSVANSGYFNDSSAELIASRQSRDIVVAFCGLIGSGIKTVSSLFEEKLAEMGYEVIKIRVSDLMKNKFPSSKLIDSSAWSPFERYKNLQDMGDDLRLNYDQYILSECVISEISIDKKMSVRNSNKAVKKAFLVDQLKNPGEVELLRAVYQHNFYLVGVFRSEEQRKQNLKEERISESQVDELIHRDRKSSENNGQQTQKAMLDADFFINNYGQRENIKNKLNRFIDLIHGVNGLTPNAQEKGMYAAFSASLQSACLSRQVGAAIFDSQGNLVSIGKNDVPKAGGGLYSTDDNFEDQRCIHKGGKCYNDSRKSKIKDQIEEILVREGLGDKSSTLAESIFKETPISSIIEYSRSIHAEMDAIVALSRSSMRVTKGATIYTTTFPCHNCARHIVAAGISKAIYIEPYDKSLALDLHDDSISKIGGDKKVSFEIFEGVSPRRYQKFFFPVSERKDSLGIAVKKTTKNGNHIDIQYLDSYEDFETKVSARFMEKLELEF